MHLLDFWHRGLFPKNTVQYGNVYRAERIDQILCENTFLRYLATNIEFVAAKSVWAIEPLAFTPLSNQLNLFPINRWLTTWRNRLIVWLYLLTCSIPHPVQLGVLYAWKNLQGLGR